MGPCRKDQGLFLRVFLIGCFWCGDFTVGWDASKEWGVLYVLIALGCALGGGVPLALAGFMDRRFGGAFPWGTFCVNVAGSFLLGALLGAEALAEGDV